MPTIQVLDPAVVPELPVGRGTVRKGLMAGIAAFTLGIFLAFGREYVAQARRSQGETVPARKQKSEAPASGTQLDA